MDVSDSVIRRKEKEIPGYSKMKKEELLEVLMNDIF